MSEDRKVFPVLLSREMIRSLKTEAAQTEQSASAIIRAMLIERMKQPAKPKAEPKDRDGA